MLIDVRTDRDDDLGRVRRVDNAGRVVGRPEDRPRGRVLLRHAGPSEVVPLLVGRAVRQVVVVRHLDRCREGVAAVDRLGEQDLVPIVGADRGVVEVRPGDVERSVWPDERLRELVLVALSVRRARAEGDRA